MKLKVPFAVADVLERFGFAMPKDGEALPSEAAVNEPQQPGQPDPAQAARVNADAAEDAFPSSGLPPARRAPAARIADRLSCK